MPRITSLNDTGMDVIIKLADGNPGATTVMVEIYKQGATIDPDSALGGIGAILALDTHGIYGPRIWMLYKDVCGQDLRVMLAILRAVQLGFLSESTLNYAIDNSRRSPTTLDVPALVAKVEQRLPRFQRAAPVPDEVPPTQSHVDYLNAQENGDDATSDFISGVIAAEVASEVFSSNDSPSFDSSSPDSSTSSDFGGFDGGDSGGGGASGDF